KPHRPQHDFCANQHPTHVCQRTEGPHNKASMHGGSVFDLLSTFEEFWPWLPSSTTTCLTCLLLNARVPNEAPWECSESIPEDRPVRFLLFLKTCWNGLSAAYHMAHPP
ncbi:CRISPR system single-strand-specific deoxyribonuclease Cas10/Csm1 (subtype III-A), partial [Dissostichus eleginoides]